jgi:hypothetical protein
MTPSAVELLCFGPPRKSPTTRTDPSLPSLENKNRTPSAPRKLWVDSTRTGAIFLPSVRALSRSCHGPRSFLTRGLLSAGVAGGEDHCKVVAMAEMFGPSPQMSSHGHGRSTACLERTLPFANNYSLCPKLLECFDWNTNIKESVRNS